MIAKSLYERLGGVFAIAAVVDHFSDAVVQNATVRKTSKNQALQEWHTKSLGRLLHGADRADDARLGRNRDYAGALGRLHVSSFRFIDASWVAALPRL